MTAASDENSLEARLSGLKLGTSSPDTEGIDGETLLSAFRTEASPRSRALATLALSRNTGRQREAQTTKLLQSTVRSALSALDEDVEGHTAALRLLSTLYALDPSAAHTLFRPQGETSLWTSILPRIESASNVTISLLRAELLSSAAAHTPSRTQLKGDDDVAQWLASAVAQGKGEEAPLAAQRVALVAGLASYKLERGPSTSEQEELGATASTSEDTAELQTRHEAQDRLLLSLARPHIVSADAQTLDQEASRLTLLSSLEALSYLSSLPAIKEAITDDSTLLQKLCGLPSTTKHSLERKPVFPSRKTENAQNGQSSYDLDSTLSSPLRQADSSLQYALSTIILNLVAYRPILSYEEQQMKKLREMANAKKAKEAGAQKAGGAKGDPRDSVSSVDKRVSKAIAAGATQALVGISLVGGRTADDSSTSGSTVSPAVRVTLGQAFLHLTFKQDKLQRGKIAQAGGARALLVLSTHAINKLSSDAPAPSNPLQRSFPSSASESSTLAPLQALARLCITASPAILFGSPANALAALPTLAALYLHATSEPLQRFEALLALTNLASLDAQLASAVAKARMASHPPAPARNGDSTAPSAPKNVDADAQRTVADAMEDSILLEDNAMIRRAAVELLCNLAQDESVFKRWTGEEEEEKGSQKATGSTRTGSAAGPGKAGRRIHLLVALCSPADTAEQGDEPASGSGSGATPSAKETSLPTRLAASGALAMLSSSAACCSHLLALRPRSLNILVRLVKPGTGRSKHASPPPPGAKIQEIKEEEDEIETASRQENDEEGEAEAEGDTTDEELESRLENSDAASSPSGVAHARASLAIRGVSVLHALVSFLQWQKEQVDRGGGGGGVHGGGAAREEFKAGLQTFQASGAIEALRCVALEGAREMQSSGGRGAAPSPSAVNGSVGSQVEAEAGGEAEARGMRGEVTKMAFECLKMLSAMGVHVT